MYCKTFNSFPVASLVGGELGDPPSEAGVTPFQFFPSCFLTRALSRPPHGSSPFNSFPVASRVQAQKVEDRIFISFQFFPSCFEGREDVGVQGERDLSILSQLLPAQGRE